MGRKLSTSPPGAASERAGGSRLQLSSYGDVTAGRLGADCLTLTWLILNGISICCSDPVSSMSGTAARAPRKRLGVHGLGARGCEAAVGCILVPGGIVASFRIDGYLNVTYGLATKDAALS
jgi:hypothetical protein